MAHVFLSYASVDREKARRLAEAMEARGYRVWWDRQIAPGQTFDEVIEKALDEAKCVVVLWSATSVKSDWVKVEAAEAAKRKVLVPALIDAVTIPLEFRRIQAAVRKTIVIVTHDMAEALSLATRIGVLADGVLVALDPPPRIAESADPRVRGLLAPLLEASEALKGQDGR